jgi:glycosyltransferase involved in cell wall biosynthesis
MAFDDMKIHLLYDAVNAPWGGVNSFFRNFAACAERSERVEAVDSPRGADIVLTAGHFRGPGAPLLGFQARNAAAGRSVNSPLGFISRGTRGKRPKLVFRLDGLRSVYAGNGPSAADGRLLANLEYADAAVFQSRFAEECFEKTGIHLPERRATILNGADAAVFRPADEPPPSDGPTRLLSVSWSKNERKGFADIAEFSKLDGVSVRHIGRWPEKIPPGKVEFSGTRNPREIAELLRDSRFLLFPSRGEACPNVVAEALASGVPVIYHDSGGTPELCGHGEYGVPLPDAPVDFATFATSLPEDFSRLRENILRDIERFSFDRCFEEYLDFFETLT